MPASDVVAGADISWMPPCSADCCCSSLPSVDAGYSWTFILPPLLAATSSPKRLTPKLTGWSALLRWPKRMVRSCTSCPKAGRAKPIERPAKEMARRRGSIETSPSYFCRDRDALTFRTSFHYGIRLTCEPLLLRGKCPAREQHCHPRHSLQAKDLAAVFPGESDRGAGACSRHETCPSSRRRSQTKRSRAQEPAADPSLSPVASTSTPEPSTQRPAAWQVFAWSALKTKAPFHRSWCRRRT